MDLLKFKKSFPDAEERKGDLGSYLEIRIKADMYVTIFANDYSKPVLDVKGRHISASGVKTPSDVKKLIDLMNE